MNELKVREVMTRLVVSLSPDETIHEAAARLAANAISGAPVVDNGVVVGMVTESDILHAIAPVFPRKRRSILEILLNNRNMLSAHPPWGPLVEDVMSSLVVIKISPEASIWEAASLLESRGVKRLPVISEDGQLVGIISRADIIRAMDRTDAAIEEDVRETLQALDPGDLTGLEVRVEQGAATLRGLAGDKKSKKAAVRLVRRVPGVLSVKDELRTKTEVAAA